MVADQAEPDPRILKHQVLQKIEGQKKSYIKAFFLCLILGFWGAHRFYLGHKKRARIMAVIWAILLLMTLIAGFWDKVLLAAIWGYWDSYDVLNEVMVVVGIYSQIGASAFDETSILAVNYQHIIPDALRVCYGLFVIWELFRIIGLTDRVNEAIKKDIERDVFAKG